jgi:hypothetical protein
LENVFSFAEREISGIPCILTADQCEHYPDEKSILTYVSFFYRKYKGTVWAVREMSLKTGRSGHL